MSNRQYRYVAYVLFFSLAASACSSAKTDGLDSLGQEQTAAQGSLGKVVGSAQLALRSGDVKPIPFTSVKLVVQGYEVFTPTEKEAIQYDVRLGIQQLRLGMIRADELDRKTRAWKRALDSFLRRLPQKQAIPSFATATTDAGGAFEFDSVPAGIYWVFLDTKIAINLVGWAVRVGVKPGETTRVDLNNTNMDYSVQR